MEDIFIGRVIDSRTNRVLHQHFSSYADDSFQVSLWYGSKANECIRGEFRKFHHLETLIKEKYPFLRTERVEGYISIDAMIPLVKNQSY